MLPWVTTWVSGSDEASTSNRPLTILRSGATDRRYSYVGLSVRLPRQSVWLILPGARSFLNYKGGWRVSTNVCLLLGRDGDKGDSPCLSRNIQRSVWDVKVADYKNEERHGVCAALSTSDRIYSLRRTAPGVIQSCRASSRPTEEVSGSPTQIRGSSGSAEETGTGSAIVRGTRAR